MKCRIIFDSEQPFIEHFVQALAGFRALEHSKKIQLSTCYEKLKLPRSCFEVIINDHKIIYDLSDGTHNLPLTVAKQMSRNFEYIFKRAYDAKEYAEINNIHPYGLNYYPRNFIWNHINFLKPYNYPFCSLPYFWNMRPLFHHHMPAKEMILLYTRLWDKDSTSDNNFNKINDFRILSIQALRKEFKSIAYAGVADSPIARKLCPDLILAKTATQRNRFLRIMSQASICIATTGLWNSIGWRFGEYVAAAKAIISEPLHYSVPGNFASGNNYLEFRTTDNLLEQCELLRKDNEFRAQIERNNDCYYDKFLCPDVLIQNTLDIVVKK